jgi:hypothetical protein
MGFLLESPVQLADSQVPHLSTPRGALQWWVKFGSRLTPNGWVDRALAQCRAQAWTVMVLHDLPTGAMHNLERFLDAVAEQVRFRQDFAPECVPILDGRIIRPLDDVLSPTNLA